MTSTRQRLLGLLCLAALILGPIAAAEGQTAPRRGGTVRMVEPGEPDSLDMARTLANYSFIVGEQIFEGLFRWTPKGLVPWLAQDVRVSPDGRSWTLKLRQGVLFHDGTPLNAEAVKFNLERIRDGKAFTYAGLLAPLADIKAADDHTVQITMKTPLRAVPRASRLHLLRDAEPDGPPEARRGLRQQSGRHRAVQVPVVAARR
jgi:peptide/nickel transport system substrate-binding protein